MGTKVPATIILPSEKEIIKSNWGLYAVGFRYLDLVMGITHVPVNASKSFHRVVSVNKEQNALRLITPEDGTIYINLRVENKIQASFLEIP